MKTELELREAWNKSLNNRSTLRLCSIEAHRFIVRMSMMNEERITLLRETDKD